MSEWLSPLVEMGVLTPGLVELLGIGGPVVAILLVFSMVAVTLIIGKSLQLFLATWQSKTKVSDSLSLWRDGQVRDAHSLLMTCQQPVPALVASAMASVMRHGDAPLVREELARQASRHLASLKCYLKPLEVIATLSPLLGLLGTVMGMILAFQQMEAAGNQVDPSVLSGGIWQALLTTAAGLIVAIPVVMLHSYLERKTDRLVDEMEDALTAVFTGPLVGNTSGAVNVSEPAANPLNASDERRGHAA